MSTEDAFNLPTDWVKVRKIVMFDVTSVRLDIESELQVRVYVANMSKKYSIAEAAIYGYIACLRDLKYLGSLEASNKA